MTCEVSHFFWEGELTQTRRRIVVADARTDRIESLQFTTFDIFAMEIVGILDKKFIDRKESNKIV
jgi:hypothetical protein